MRIYFIILLLVPLIALSQSKIINEHGNNKELKVIKHLNKGKTLKITVYSNHCIYGIVENYTFVKNDTLITVTNDSTDFILTRKQVNILFNYLYKNDLKKTGLTINEEILIRFNRFNRKRIILAGGPGTFIKKLRNIR